MLPFLQPEMLFAIIPVFFILLIIIKKDFIKFDRDHYSNPAFARNRARTKFWIFLSRFLIFSLLIIALAQPYATVERSDLGNPKVTVLIDNSTSMDIYDLRFVNGLLENIGDEVPVDLHYISDGLHSDLGDEILSNLDLNKNILLISDGQVTEGTDLNDVMLYATTLNASISAVELTPKQSDVSVVVTGPSKTVKDVDNTYHVKVNKINTGSYSLVVTVDDEVVINTKDHREDLTFNKKFQTGTHTITARVSETDYFSENNIFYKTVHVVDKPKILYLSRAYNPVEIILNQMYDVDKKAQIPATLDDYYAVVINDMPADTLANVQKLSEFITNSNGMVVIGGLTSFDRGGYKDSLFETLLPVYVGKGDKQRGDTNIVLVVDLSGSTSDRTFEGSSTTPLDVEKAMVVDILETLNLGNRVGVVVFAIPDGLGSMKAVKVSDVLPLQSIKGELIEKVKRLKGPGQSLFDLGLRGGYSLLKGLGGSRAIIFLSDGGVNVYQPIKDNAEQIVKIMASEGIKVYTVGIGTNVDEEWMKKMAEEGEGIYFPASQQNRLKILFGDPEEKKIGDSFDLFILNPYHFITEDLELNAVLYGYNQVIPKSLSKLLVTTDNGEPAVTTWRYGLGRVTTLTVFSSENDLGQLLNGRNSLLITRIVNHAIGDPERKKDYYVQLPDTRINSSTLVTVRSKKYPESKEIQLIKISEDLYQGKFTPTSTGYHALLGEQFAVNNPKEYEQLGMSNEMRSLIQNLGGKMFLPQQDEEIVKYIKSVSRRTRMERTVLWWPFVIGALSIFLLEVCIRRLRESYGKK